MPVDLCLILTLVAGFPIVFLALACLGRALIDVQPTLQLLRAALLGRRGVPFTFLLAQGVELGLQGIITGPRRIVGVTHVGSS
jgi:hypothetical protein